MANIYTLLNKIKNAVYGIDVRDAIHDAIKQTYRDATHSGNTNTEVVEARGEYETLLERLNSMENNNSINIFDEIIVKTDKNINIVLEDKKCFLCNDVESLTILATNIDIINFCSRVIFSAMNDFTIDTISFVGEHCENGLLKVKEGNKYVINFLFTGYEIIGLSQCSHNNNGDIGDENAPGEEDEELHDFYGAAEFVALARAWHDKRAKYLTYGQTNAFSNNGNKTWSEVTVTGADSPDGRYRKIDCSGVLNAWMRGLSFDDIYADELTYNTKDLSARTDKYDWALEPPRTAAEICEWLENLGYALNNSQLHTEGTTDYSGLKMGDIIFRGGTTNGRYKGVYHVEVYYGKYIAQDGTEKYVIIEATSSTNVSKHSDGITKGMQILQFNKKSTSDIVCVARLQSGNPKS